MKVFGIFLLFALSGSLSGEVLFGKRIETNFPPAVNEFKRDFARDEKQLDISSIVRISDAFLAKEFGDKFKPQITAISLFAHSVKGGRIWCWCVSYIHPESDDMGNRIFRVYLTHGGEVMTKIE